MRYSTMDTVLGINRSFLASTRDQKKLHFQYEEPDEASSPQPQVSSPAQVSNPVATIQAVVDSDLNYPTVPDAEVSSLERVQTVIASKLKKGRNAVMPSRSIKEITAGGYHKFCYPMFSGRLI